jgi:TPR repeat protein
MKNLIAMIITTVMLLGAAQAGAGNLADYEQKEQEAIDAYEKGDYATALHIWKPRAEEESIKHQILVGGMYLRGEGTTQNYGEAAKWLSKAAIRGLAVIPKIRDIRKHRLQHMKEQTAVEKRIIDTLKSEVMILTASIADAQVKLGVMYYKGWGVIQDNVTAHMWFNIASSLDNKLAGKSRDAAGRTMTPAAIEEAQRRAKICVKSEGKNCD